MSTPQQQLDSGFVEMLHDKPKVSQHKCKQQPSEPLFEEPNHIKEFGKLLMVVGGSALAFFLLLLMLGVLGVI